MQFNAVSFPTSSDDAPLDHDRLVHANNHAHQQQSYTNLEFAKAACIIPAETPLLGGTQNLYFKLL